MSDTRLRDELSKANLVSPPNASSSELIDLLIKADLPPPKATDHFAARKTYCLCIKSKNKYKKTPGEIILEQRKAAVEKLDQMSDDEIEVC